MTTSTLITRQVKKLRLPSFFRVRNILTRKLCDQGELSCLHYLMTSLWVWARLQLQLLLRCSHCLGSLGSGLCRECKLNTPSSSTRSPSLSQIDCANRKTKTNFGLSHEKWFN